MPNALYRGVGDIPLSVTLHVRGPLDQRRWGPTLDRLERLVKAERPGEVGDAMASVGGTAIAIGALAVGLLALVEAGVIEVPQSVKAIWQGLSGQLETAEKVKRP